MTEQKLDWRIDDLTWRMSIADSLTRHIQEASDCKSRYFCDVDLRLAIQLTIESGDPDQIYALNKALCNPRLGKPTVFLLKIEREHRPKAAAAIAEFMEAFKKWNEQADDTQAAA
jgi:hypothetical protein